MMLSPGVQVNEIDLSIVVPNLGNSIACFAGEFTKGPSDKYVNITNVDELISVFGKPTDLNYNDWYQCYNFLQYSNKLLISRAVDSSGTFKDTNNVVLSTKELGKVEIETVPTFIQAGSIVKFGYNNANEYKVIDIEYPKEAVKQVDIITIDSAQVGDYVIQTETSVAVYSSILGDTTSIIANNLGAALENLDTSATNISVTGNIITVTATTAGVPMSNNPVVGIMRVSTKTASVAGKSYQLVFDKVAGQTVDFSAINESGNVISGAIIDESIYSKNSALNSIVTAPIEGKTAKTASELKLETIFLTNQLDFDISKESIPLFGDTKLKFIARDSGSLQNGIEITIARESDFITGTQTAFKGLLLNDFFEVTPSEAKKEIAILIKKDNKVSEVYIGSLIPDSKDYKNKSNYIEDIINKYSKIIYLKNNTRFSEMPDSRLYTPEIIDQVTGTTISEISNKILYLSNGEDGFINSADIDNAYGNVANNSIFGNKEEIDIDIVISNERSRISGARLANERGDCIAFHGSRFEDIVGISSTQIVENLIMDVNSGELNSSDIANSYNAYFGNYKQQYDKYNDKIRWVSIAGDVSGLRADTNTKRDTWFASAGLERGKIKNALKIAFNPNRGQLDLLYKNKVNPIVSFPGQGNALVWGQKTLESKPSSFSRINVRGLFNTLERAISRMARYYLFEMNDEITRNRFIGTIKPFLESVKAGRGVYDFYVRCDESNNNSAVIDSNQFIADIAIKPTRVSEFITLNFIAVGTGVDFSEVFA